MPTSNKQDEKVTRKRVNPGRRLKLFLRKVRNLQVLFVLKVILLGLLFFQMWYWPEFPDFIGIGQAPFDALVFFLTGNVITDFSRQMLILFYIRKHKLTGQMQSSFIVGVGRFATLASVILLAFAGLILFEINTLELFASISIVAAGIAILSKDYITTMVNGMVLMFGNHLSLDDYVKIGEYKGRVVDITLLDLVIRTDNEELVLIPNNTAMVEPIVNYTTRPVKMITIDFETPLPCPIKLDALNQHLIDILADYEHLLDPNRYDLKITELKAESMHLQFQYVFKVPEREAEREIERKILRGVVLFLKREAKQV